MRLRIGSCMIFLLEIKSQTRDTRNTRKQDKVISFFFFSCLSCLSWFHSYRSGVHSSSFQTLNHFRFRGCVCGTSRAGLSGNSSGGGPPFLSPPIFPQSSFEIR